MAHEQPGFGRQGEDPADRLIELGRIAAGKVSPGRAIVRHEQRIADEHGIAHLVNNAGRRVPRGVQHLDGQFAELEGLAIREQVIELGPGAGYVRRIEHTREDLLDLANVRADPHPRPGAGLDQRRGGQVIGMGVGFQHAGDPPPARRSGGEHGLGRAGRNPT